MAKQKILIYPHLALTTPTKKVIDFGPNFQKLVADLILTKEAHEGLGLAAPQIGVNLRVAVIGFEPKNKEDEKLRVPAVVLVNPKIISESAEQKEWQEGCLSLPGLELPIKRAAKIKVLAFNRRGKKIKTLATDFFARVVLHEIDHLNGVLIIDRAVKTKENQRKIKEYISKNESKDPK
ncbi:peptide deformylase [Candidatus Berkelbacteria bacterium]|nr:peptide deformylase [Candidatus Berkelbacteria bacterium]